MSARASHSGTGRRLALLGVLVAATALANWHVATLAIDITAIAPPGPVDAASAGGGEASRARPIPPLARLTETPARPLMSPTRRQPTLRPVASAQAPALAQGPDGLVLAGVLKSGEKVRRALIRTSNAPHGAWVEVGDDVQGWILVEVGDGLVVLEQAGRRHEVAMRRAPPRQSDRPDTDVVRPE